MYDILADFDFVYCPGILYRLRVLALAFYDGLFFCYVFSVVVCLGLCLLILLPVPFSLLISPSVQKPETSRKRPSPRALHLRKRRRLH